MQVIRKVIARLQAWLAQGCLMDLLSVRRHPILLARQRLSACILRIRLATVAFSVLTLAWIPLDALTLTPEQWKTLAVGRMIAALVFLGLALMPDHDPTPLRTLFLLALMLAMPLMIYAISQYLFSGQPLRGPAVLNADLYQALPWVVLAGLSIFPLVATEGLALAALITSTVLTVNLLWMKSSMLTNLTTMLVMLLVSGVYLLSCAIQLHYMRELLRRAAHDPLTDALARRGGAEVLDLHYQVSSRLDQPLSLLFIDADNFKSLNDDFGHRAGDQALVHIVDKLHAVLRQGDLVIRWGGEEFVVALVNTPLSGAYKVLTHLTRDWFGPRPDGSPLTASIGLAERRTDAVRDWVQLVALADQRMYEAKAAGKACCIGPDGAFRLSRPAPDSTPAAAGHSLATVGPVTMA